MKERYKKINRFLRFLLLGCVTGALIVAVMSAQARVLGSNPSLPIKLNLSHVGCISAGQVEVHFVAVHVPAGVSDYGQVMYEINGISRVAHFIKAVGKVAHYVDVMNASQTGTYAVSSGFVMIDGVRIDLHNPQTVTAKCIPPPAVCKLVLSKIVDRQSAAIGDTLTYTLTVENVGTADCTGSGVRITDVVPAELTFLSETHTGTIAVGYGATPLYTPSSRTLTWNAFTLAPGASGSITWKGTIQAPSACGWFEVDNHASVTSFEYDNFNTYVDSNTVMTGVEHECAPSVSVSCSASPSSASVNSPITFTAVASGGLGGFSYHWSGDDGLTGDATSTAHSFSTAGEKQANVTVTSGADSASTSCTATVTEISTPPLTGSCHANPVLGFVGDTISWIAQASGGAGDFNFNWSGDDGLSGTSTLVMKSYASSGVKTSTVAIASGTETITRSCQVSILSTPPASARLTVIKHVRNDSGGSRSASDFSISLSRDGHDVSGSPFFGSETGVVFTLPTGTYTVEETDPSVSGYVFEGIVGDCSTGGVVSLADGDAKTCTLTNDDIATTTPSHLAASCHVSPDPASVGAPTTFTAIASGGVGPFAYVWSGDDGLSGASTSTTITYASEGTKHAQIVITAGSETATTTCSVAVSSSGGGGSDGNGGGGGGGSTGGGGSGGENTGGGGSGGTGGDTGSASTAGGGTTGGGGGSTGGGNGPITPIVVGGGSGPVGSITGGGGNGPINPTVSGGAGTPTVVLLKKAPEGRVLGAVYLSEVPYTGFGDWYKVALFVLILVIWSFSVVYFFKSKLWRKGGATLSVGLSPKQPLAEAIPYQEPVMEISGEDIADPELSFAPAGAEAYAPVPLEEANPDKNEVSSVGFVDIIAAEAQRNRVVISEEGMKLIAQMSGSDATQVLSLTEKTIRNAETRYDREDGWLLLNKEKVLAALNAKEPERAPELSHHEPRPVSEPKAAAPHPQPPVQGPLSRSGVDSALFVNWLATGDKYNLTRHLKTLREQGGNPEAFLRRVVLDLDVVYRSRLEDIDEPIDERLAHSISGLSNEQLENLISVVLSTVDQSYHSASVGVKVALMRASEVKRQRS